ncbi:MAG: FAD-binding oxidoreductase [Desulfobacterales bacterium]
MTDLNNIGNELMDIVGPEHVETDARDVEQYAVDGTVPAAVVFPKDTKQVSEVVTYADRKNLAIIPFGSGTKMGSGHPPKRLDFVLSTARLNRMVDVDTDNLTFTVEAGVKFRDIQARLATEEDRCYLPIGDLETEAEAFICSDRSHSGCFMPLDPPFSARATIGGILASNSTGPRRLLYGLPRDILLGIRFVTPGGAIVGTGGKTVKNVSGYDVSKLMIGSAGPLGILCEMTLRLLPLPERMETILVAFDSFKKTSAFVETIFNTQLLPAAVEVMNKRAVESFQNSKSDFTPGLYSVAVALEAYDEAVERMKSEMLGMAGDLEAKDRIVLSEDGHRLFWHSMGNLQTRVAGRFPGKITVKLNYQISDWKDIIQFTDEMLSSNHLEYTLLCQAGNGGCSINFLLTGDDKTGSEKAVSTIDLLLEEACRANGNLVVQNAPADLKKDLPMWGKPRLDFQVMQRVKNRLDPKWIMSPGRFTGEL